MVSCHHLAISCGLPVVWVAGLSRFWCESWISHQILILIVAHHWDSLCFTTDCGQGNAMIVSSSTFFDVMSLSRMYSKNGCDVNKAMWVMSLIHIFPTLFCTTCREFIFFPLTRAVASVFYSTVFSLSLSEATMDFGFPIDYHLVFVLLSCTFLITVLMVACLPTSINHQKIIEDT